MTIRRLFCSATLVSAFALAVHACTGAPTGPAGTARVQVLLTDAPADLIASAEVWISRAYLQGGNGDDAPRIDLFNDPENPRVFDLLELQDGVTAALTEAVEIDAASYAQLRLIVDSARVTLVDGTTFSDGTSTRLLFVPSGSETGIKVQLTEPIDTEEGETTVIVVDFDVAENFVLQGNPGTPAGIQGILFTPVLVEKNRQQEDAN